jgi:hypothetical protein
MNKIYRISKKLNTLNYGNKIIIYLHFSNAAALILLYTLKRKTAEDLVNEFAATLDSLPNKKKKQLKVETKHQEVDYRSPVLTPYSLTDN